MTNKNAIECIIKGIKCDHCNFRDDAVNLEDYKEWLNKPCPQCGENLLTDADLKTCQTIIANVKTFNKLVAMFGLKEKAEETVLVSVEMDGSGKANFVKAQK